MGGAGGTGMDERVYARSRAGDRPRVALPRAGGAPAREPLAWRRDGLAARLPGVSPGARAARARAAQRGALRALRRLPGARAAVRVAQPARVARGLRRADPVSLRGGA